MSGVVRGDIADLYHVGGGLLKVPRDPADNDLMRREATALTQLGGAVDPALLAYFPRLAVSGRRDDARSGIRRHINLIAGLPGFRSLADVRSAFPAGIDPRDAAWMWRRLLVAAGAAHRAGVIHGAVLPEHVMIHPAEHGLVLVDWCYSVPAPAGRIPAAGRLAAAGRARRAARAALRAAQVPALSPLRQAGLGITAKETHGQRTLVHRCLRRRRAVPRVHRRQRLRVQR